MAFDPSGPQAPSHNAYLDLDAVRENLNQLRKCEAGPSAPANLVAGMLWLDTSASPYVLKQRNDANNAWITLWGTTTAPSAHRLAATLDHPDASVTNAKVASGISASKMTTGTLPVAQVPTIPWTKIGTPSVVTTGSITLDLNDVWTLPAGVYNTIIVGADVYLRIDVGGWRTSTLAFTGGMIFSDGSNVRLYSANNGQIIYYLKF